MAWTTARKIAGHADSKGSELIGRGLIALIESTVDADLRETTDLLSRLRVAQHAQGHGHHEAITLLNLAYHHKVRGDARAALQHADDAVSLLAGDVSGGEMAAARAVRSWALAHLGDLEAARELYRVAIDDVDESSRAEILLEAAEIELWYGDAERADDLQTDAARQVEAKSPLEQFVLVVQAEAAIRKRRLGQAELLISRFRIGEFGIVSGLKAQQLSIQAHWSLLAGDPAAGKFLREAIEHADAQGANFWLEVDRLLLGAAEGPEALNHEVRKLGDGSSVDLNVVAESMVDRLTQLGNEESALVRREMGSRRDRWLPALREAITDGSDVALPAARCLDEIGSLEDVSKLRRFSKRRSVDPDLGKGLARRVAAKVFVEDQGRVVITIGPRRIEGTSIRRKVLTMLCFLLTRPRFSSTRDEVLDALWPDLSLGRPQLAEPDDLLPSQGLRTLLP